MPLIHATAIETKPVPLPIRGTANRIVETRFGPLEFAEERTLLFPQGLVGFSNYREFGLIEIPENAYGPLMLLQSMSDPSLSFIVAMYNRESQAIDESDLGEACAALEIQPENCLVLLVVTVRKDAGGVTLTTNLRAPLLIDAITQVGRQYVLANPRYEVRHAL